MYYIPHFHGFRSMIFVCVLDLGFVLRCLFSFQLFHRTFFCIRRNSTRTQLSNLVHFHIQLVVSSLLLQEDGALALQMEAKINLFLDMLGGK